MNAEQQLRDNDIRGDYVSEDNLHLTLAFIGEVSDPSPVQEALSKVKFKPFRLSLSGTGSFDHSWWVGVNASNELKRCDSQLRRYLTDSKIPFDKKKLSPHITLVRDPSKPAMPRIRVPRAEMTITSISLMLSEKGEHGSAYTRIGSVEADSS